MSETKTVALPPVTIILSSGSIMADLRQNGKSQFMEPLSSDIRLPDILLDRQSREPLHKQITRQIAHAIREGSMRPGCRLPSTRRLAHMLSVSRNTVLV